MKRKVITLAVDPGYSSFKCVVEGIIFSIPRDVVDNTGNENLFVADKKENFYAIDIFGKNYLVGDYARKLLLESNRQYDRDFNEEQLNDFSRFETNEFEVSILAVIGIALTKYCEFTQEQRGIEEIKVEDLSNCDIYLAICLPQAVFAMGAKGQVGHIRDHIFKSHDFTLETSTGAYKLSFAIKANCAYKFQSQVITALLGVLEDEHGESLDIIDEDEKAKPILVIDGGYKTVGIFKLSQIDTVEEAESNDEFSMLKVDQKVAKIISEEGGRDDIKTYNIEELYNAHEEIVVDDGDGNTKLITINKERDQICEEYCHIMIDYLCEKYNGLKPIKQILITGGTGAAYYDTFVKWINEKKSHLQGKVKLAEYKFMGQKIDPTFSIVVGLYKQFRMYLDNYDLAGNDE